MGCAQGFLLRFTNGIWLGVTGFLLFLGFSYGFSFGLPLVFLWYCVLVRIVSYFVYAT